ncbi:YihY/virulence factor BrkB family protein [Mucilaginibacter sp. X5P1]|uniref:YihY/virulence factor BrkB family protein n=1 Tax=Mucilaginibacter sp. X5P1 TaxID=2723088 RepID=UPI00160E08BD|nr:YihY/virulence factor BrkB family protein [Mucilaginibacter sp. X5P1]MBB6139810.1 membrane protein [Mucilaginibacter sp. X5P1]
MKIFSKTYIKRLWKVLVATFMGFVNDNGLKLSASLAYYTIFSLAPLLVLILALIGIFLRDESNRELLYVQIQHYVGLNASDQIKSIIKNYAFNSKSGVALITGIGILLLGASSMFVEIQDSLNTIWRVKAKPKKGWLKLLQNRFLSFSLIASLGFLLLVSLLVNIVITALSNKIDHFFPGVEIIISVVNLAITLVVIMVLFGIIFKVLPDVKISWKDVRTGAFFTALLFMLGQYLIGLYIKTFANSSAYGAAGSLIVILIWIYYTSAILYIGAEFTQVYAEAIGSRIEPAEYAVAIKQTEVELEVNKLPPQHPDIKGNLAKPVAESNTDTNAT